MLFCITSRDSKEVLEVPGGYFKTHTKGIRQKIQDIEQAHLYMGLGLAGILLILFTKLCLNGN